jgi:DNA-binding FadR family transcriptional regulator
LAPELSDLLTIAAAEAAGLWRRRPSRRRYLARVVTEHRAIEAAIHAGDVGAAQQAMRAHLQRSLTRYRRLAKQSASGAVFSRCR